MITAGRSTRGAGRYSGTGRESDIWEKVSDRSSSGSQFLRGPLPRVERREHLPGRHAAKMKQSVATAEGGVGPIESSWRCDLPAITRSRAAQGTTVVTSACLLLLYKP